MIQYLQFTTSEGLKICVDIDAIIAFYESEREGVNSEILIVRNTSNHFCYQLEDSYESVYQLLGGK